MKNRYDDMTVGEYLKNPPKEAEPNEFANFKKYPCWGRPTIEEKDHPWFAFFQEKFDCAGFEKRKNTFVNLEDLPVNLYSSGFYEVRKQFSKFLESQDGFLECSDFLKTRLTDSFWGEVSWANRNLPNPRFHDGKNLSRGSLSRFLSDVWNITFSPELLTGNDRKFIMKYLFCITKNTQADTLKIWLTHSEQLKKQKTG